jgi:hypothetical protein
MISGRRKPNMSDKRDHSRVFKIRPVNRRLERTIGWILSKGTVRGDYREIRLREYIAAVISMTYLEQGDQAKLADDRALMIIRDLLLAYDENIIERNRQRKIPFKYYPR